MCGVLKIGCDVLDNFSSKVNEGCVVEATIFCDAMKEDCDVVRKYLAL